VFKNNLFKNNLFINNLFKNIIHIKFYCNVIHTNMDKLPNYTENDLYYNEKGELPKTKLYYNISMLIKDFSMKYKDAYGIWYANSYNMLRRVRRSLYDDDDYDEFSSYSKENKHNYTCDMLDNDVKLLLKTISDLVGNDKIFIQFKTTQYIISEIYNGDDMINKYKYLKYFPDFFNNITYVNGSNICILNGESHIDELVEIEKFRESFKVLGPTIFENNNFLKIFNVQ